MSKLETAATIFKALPRLPKALYETWLGVTDTIYLDDDSGEKIGVVIAKARKKQLIYISGLGFRRRDFTYGKAMDWANTILETAAELRGYEDEEPPVDQHRHRIRIPNSRRRLSVRNTIRLAFAVDQIINSGPTYFSQHSTGGMFNFIDMADYPVPDIRKKRNAANVA